MMCTDDWNQQYLDRMSTGCKAQVATSIFEELDQSTPSATVIKMSQFDAL